MLTLMTERRMNECSIKKMFRLLIEIHVISSHYACKGLSNLHVNRTCTGASTTVHTYYSKRRRTRHFSFSQYALRSSQIYVMLCYVYFSSGGRWPREVSYWSAGRAELEKSVSIYKLITEMLSTVQKQSTFPSTKIRRKCQTIISQKTGNKIRFC